MKPKKSVQKKEVSKKPQVCVELKDCKRVCFGGTMEAMGYFVDLIGSGDLKITSISLLKKQGKAKNK